MKTTVTKLLATVAAASTIFGMSTLPAFAAEGKSASNGNSVNISDVNATAETRALFDKLKNSGKGDLRFGQQHATDENISSSASQGDVYEMTGKYPAVFGWDAGLALRGTEKPGSGQQRRHRDTVRTLAQPRHRQGFQRHHCRCFRTASRRQILRHLQQGARRHRRHRAAGQTQRRHIDSNHLPSTAREQWQLVLVGRHACFR